MLNSPDSILRKKEDFIDTMADIHRFVLLMFLVVIFGQKCAKSANMGCKEVKYKFERSAKMSKDGYESLLVPESGKLGLLVKVVRPLTLLIALVHILKSLEEAETIIVVKSLTLLIAFVHILESLEEAETVLVVKSLTLLFAIVLLLSLYCTHLEKFGRSRNYFRMARDLLSCLEFSLTSKPNI